MPVFSDGQKISETEWARLIQSVPASYVVWKDGSTYRAECLLKGGTDYSGTDAATVIQAAIDALSTVGGRILIKSGEYTISTTLRIRSNIHLKGEGKEVTILKAASGLNDNLMENYNIDTSPLMDENIIIEHLTLDHQGSSQTSGSTLALRVKNSILRNCKVMNGYNFTVYWTGWRTDPLTYAEENVIENNIIYGAGASDQFGGGLFKRCYIAGNVFDGGGGSGGFVNRLITESVIVGNVVKNQSGAGISLETGTKNIVIGNVVVDNDGTGISAPTTDDGDPYYNLVEENIVLRCKYGISIGQEAIVIGNRVEENEAAGIVALSYSIVKGNIVKNNGQDDTVNAIYRVGIRLPNSVHCIVKGNLVFDDQTTKTQQYGIWEGGTADYNQIKNNDVFGNDVSQIVKVGANSVVTGNIGFVTENSGTATISSSTYVDVTHGLAGTPTTINVTPATSGTGDWYLSNIGDTTFRINVANSGTYTFHWTAEYKP